MKDNKLVYKLYRDLDSKPTKDLFIRPLLLGAGTTIGTVINNFLINNDKTLNYIFGGAAVGFIGSGILNVYKYAKKQKNYDLSLERFKVFKEEAEKIIDKDIDISNADLMADCYDSEESAFIVTFKDKSLIIENSEDDYRCVYYDSEYDKYFDLSSARDVAYSVKKKKNK